MAFRPPGPVATPYSLASKLRAEETLLPPFEEYRPRNSPPHGFVNMSVLDAQMRMTSYQKQPHVPPPAAPRLEFIETMPDFNTIAGQSMAQSQFPPFQQNLTQNQTNYGSTNSGALDYPFGQPGQHPGNCFRASQTYQTGWQPPQNYLQPQDDQLLSWDALFTLPHEPGYLTQVPGPSMTQFIDNSYGTTQLHSASFPASYSNGQMATFPFGRPPPVLDPGLSNLLYNNRNRTQGLVYAALPSGRVVELPQSDTAPEHTKFAAQGPGQAVGPSHDEAAQSDMTYFSDDDGDWDSAFDDSDTDENDEDDDETKEEFRNRLIHVLKQMMFVSGETVEPSTGTTWMIEEIVREQVVEMLKEATMLANRRGSKSISIVDLIFQIRHNPAKVSRLKTFLSWKDVRKNVKDSDDKAGGADADALDLEDGALPGANPAAPQKTSTNKKAKLILPWEVQSFYNETVPEREDEEDEEEEEQNDATLARLASADERTRNMTKDEYVYWSECRQASFTFRKGKRFREWAGFGTIIDSKPNDDVVDILGFLTFEIVQTLTEEALRVKAAEDLANKKANVLRGDNEASKKRKREGCTLFEMPEEGRTPVEPKHVREAFRRLQIVPTKYKFMRQGYAGVRTPLRMI